MPRHPDPIGLDEITRALHRAGEGKGVQLACLIKRCSREDLAVAFSRYGTDLGQALAMVSGRQQARQEVAAMRARARSRADRAERRDR
ncbi:hypothetical protein [Inquilinus limosus]|uniref:hypothetical protein n=1 Tax=Inquilinus limosus TaxID=171674 RepID=UPI00040C392A|nr:hypothetical protein [Inquilinus limosus]